MHWLDARSGWRSAADKLMARTSGMMFTIVAIARIRDPLSHMCGWPLWVLMLVCHQASHRLWDVDGHTRSRWVCAHACFHVCVGFGQCIILHGASGSNAEYKWL
jgi:hypothetical protein